MPMAVLVPYMVRWGSPPEYLDLPHAKHRTYEPLYNGAVADTLLMLQVSYDVPRSLLDAKLVITHICWVVRIADVGTVL
jgi:hypothetical protein